MPWASTGGPAGRRSTDGHVTVIDGSTFCISAGDGAILPGNAHGLFARDTRFLSTRELRIDGRRPEPLTAVLDEPFAATFLGRVPPAPGHADSSLLVIVRRYVGDGMREDIEIRNVGPTAATCAVDLHVWADFADLFEVKEGRAHPAENISVSRTGRILELTRRRADRIHGVAVTALRAPVMDGTTLNWDVLIPPRSEWATCVEARPIDGGVPMPLRHPCGYPVEHTLPARSLREWRSRGPEVSTSDAGLAAALERSVDDLGSLRIFDPRHPERAVVAAGVPWFMAVFGRDSLLTSWMLLPLDERLALGTLQTLAAYQGTTVDPRTEEQPGRILHEMRFGPAASLALGGGNIYYGTADATPLFVMLLGELRRWGLDQREVEALLPHADRALDWIERHGDLDGDGFVEYQRATEHGLANQGWKDSWDGITFADGDLAHSPIALAEVQGYTYAAYIARAHFAAEAGDLDAARHWEDKATSLKRAFNEAFWLPERGWYALGLDAEKRPIDSLTSNIGHCLWTGIVDDDKAPAVAQHLLSPEMFSGWGIRTLATSMTAYNPMSYHNGSVWPHDNAICAAGLMRYGFVEHAQRVAEAILDAATCFDHRPPELFCGFPRDEFDPPVPYPTSCTPQAWAAATPLHLLRTLLRFDPQIPSGRLWCDPVLPERYLPLSISRLGLSDHDVSLDVTTGGARLRGLDDIGVRMFAQPRPAHGERASEAR
ncbi:amylo-alpha-1,6-glucosidase [Qaidamihabitans albus]|uniref:amylo-alpha-1,6-glucosidase n=1 Tax=Qaidamihabitans albus TaxID=2795733 RepID=UPI0018F2194A|nr:amylo-alpha-1,6-glucosidase [Qaidamihabitans albus]